MLITTCTHCLARFRVTPQQLNEKQGQVRCGRCRKVFSGFEALERVPDDDTATRLLASREGSDADELQQDVPVVREQTIEAPEAPAIPAAPQPEPPAAAPSPPPARIEQPAPASRAMVEPPAPTPSRPLPPRPKPALVIEPPARKRPSRLWVLGAALLFVVLAAELVYGFRGTLAQRYPVARPWLDAACARAGCSVPWPRDDALLRLEDSEMLEVPGRPNEIALGARIRNLAAFAQEYPCIEVTLTDNTGQPAVRRVLRPADYLGRSPERGEALPAGADLSVQLRLETPRVRATGYELLLFYP